MDVVEKIRSFERLPDGWHLGGGVRPPSDRIESAVLYAIGLTRMFSKLDAFPGANGEILLKAYASGKERVELTFEADDTFTLAHEIDGEDQLYKDGLSVIEMTVYLEKTLRKAVLRIAQVVAISRCRSVFRTPASSALT